MRSYMQTRAIPGPWAAAERLLVCISPSPLAEKLVRNTRRLADELNAEWFAVYVEIASKPENNPANRERIGRTLQLAEELGAKSLTIAGRSIHEAVLDFARKNNITKVVVGKPIKPRWQEMLSGSIVDQLVYASGDIDVYVISAEFEPQVSLVRRTLQPHRPLARYLVSSGADCPLHGAESCGAGKPGAHQPGDALPGRGGHLRDLPGTRTVPAGLHRRRAGVRLLPGSAVFHLRRRGHAIPDHVPGAVRGQPGGQFADGARPRAGGGRRPPREADLRPLRPGPGPGLRHRREQHRQIIIAHISQAFDRDAAIFLPEDKQLRVVASSPDYQPDENERAVAVWAFEHGEPAGRGTDTLPAASMRCQPLKTSKGMVGVLGIRPKEAGQFSHAGAAPNPERLCQPGGPGARTRQPGRTGARGGTAAGDREAPDGAAQLHLARPAHAAGVRSPAPSPASTSNPNC